MATQEGRTATPTDGDARRLELEQQARESLLELGLDVETIDTVLAGALRHDSDAERLRLRAGEARTEGIVVHAPNGTITRVEGPAAELMGLTEDQLLSQKKPSDDYVAIRPDGTQVHTDELPAFITLRTGRPVTNMVMGVPIAGGRHRWLTVNSAPVAFGDETGAIVAFRDTTDRVEAEILGQRFFDLSVDMLIVFGTKRQMIRVNRSYTDRVGYSATELLTMEIADLIHPADLEPTMAMFRAGFAGERIKGFESRHRTAAGEWIWLSWHASHDQLTGNLYCVARDITDIKAKREELTRLALHDPLTGLSNRNVLGDAIPRAIARVKRDPDEPLALLYVDLDDFKRVNDEAGHAAGDLVLQAVAERLRDTCRAADLIARIGGDEFVVVAQGVAEVDALAVRIIDALNESIRVGHYTAAVGASVGVAAIRPTDSIDSVLARADGVLYEAKRAGGRTWRHAR